MNTKLALYRFTMLFAIAVIAASTASAQHNWGIGIRGGDPAGISIKKYMDGKALEINFGRSHWFSGNGWYNNRFNDWYRDKDYTYSEFQYVGYRSSTPLGLQVHYLWQKDVGRVAESNMRGLDWYVGLGGQVRMQTYTFDYRYKLYGSPAWYYETGDKVTDLDLGADGVVGLEYTFNKIPLSMFVDATLFMEIVDQPFRFWMQGGIGMRYNF